MARMASDALLRLSNGKVGTAIESGRLVRPDRCSMCGHPCKPEAHHENYYLPLFVVWLCSSCHQTRHNHPDEWYIGGVAMKRLAALPPDDFAERFGYKKIKALVKALRLATQEESGITDG